MTVVVSGSAAHVSAARVMECIDSARFWAEGLGLYANSMSNRVDGWAITAAALSTVTGLGVWSTVAGSNKPEAVVAVSAVAFLSAIAALIPKIRGYADCAKNARTLSTRYGSALGDLMDALEMLRNGDMEAGAQAKAAVAKFEATRAEKGDLKPFPAKLQKLRSQQLKEKESQH
jgi:hypothetical protein